MREQSIAKAPDSTWEVLAGLRFFLAMVVVLDHVRICAATDFFLTSLGRLSGYAAVIGFLIVSGYSIAHSLSRSSGGFYRRRFLRIYPLYAVAAIVPLAIQAMRGHLFPHEVSNAVQNLFFLQTFVTYPLMLNPVVWTLGVEVACYVAAPWLARRSTATLLSIAGVSAAAFMVYPKLGIGYYGCLLHGGALLMLGWAWLAGFIYYRHRMDQKAAKVLILVTVFLLSLNNAYGDRFYMVTVVTALAAITFGPSLVIRPWVGKVMSYAGDVSYPLYLLHVPIYLLCTGMLHLHSAYILIVAALAGGVGGLITDSLLRYPTGVAYELVQNAARATGRTVYGVAAGVVAWRRSIESVEPAGVLAAGGQ